MSEVQEIEPAVTAPPTTLAVIVVNYASHELVAANLGPLETAGRDVRVVLVDNFSDGHERAAARRLAADMSWLFVAMPDNPGFGVAVNRGVAAARDLGCECFLFLNPDARIDEPVLDELHSACVADPWALISPRIESSAGGAVFQGSEFALTDGRIRGLRVEEDADGNRRTTSRVSGPARSWLAGTCVALHRTLFDATGGFDERYFLYWEDVEFSYRCELAGGRLVLRHDLVVVHDEGGTQGARRGPAKSNLYYYYNCRNRLLFAALHLPRAQLWRWIAATPAVSWEILLRGGRRQLLHSPRPLWSALRGSIAGLRAALPRALGPGQPALPAGATGLESGRTITLAVLTYRRADELAVLLPLLLAQADDGVRADVGPGGTDVEVLVVDNDPAGSARAAVAAITDPRLRYVIEPATGIAAARNRALDECAARDVLVFIDDDEQPRPGWLPALLATYRNSRAAGVAGPVVSEFVGDPDPWITAGGFLARRHRDEVATGERIDAAATNNLLLDLRAVRALGVRFDPAFGLSGGEDSLFTRTLAAHGALLVWCREAQVVDRVPLARINRRWVLHRALSYGNNDARIAVMLASGRARRTGARGVSLGRALARLVGGCVLWVRGIMSSSQRDRATGARAAARGTGMLLGVFGHVVQQYRRD